MSALGRPEPSASTPDASPGAASGGASDAGDWDVMLDDLESALAVARSGDVPDLSVAHPTSPMPPELAGRVAEVIAELDEVEQLLQSARERLRHELVTARRAPRTAPVRDAVHVDRLA